MQRRQDAKVRHNPRSTQGARLYKTQKGTAVITVLPGENLMNAIAKVYDSPGNGVSDSNLPFPIEERNGLLGDIGSMIRSTDHIQTIPARDPFTKSLGFTYRFGRAKHCITIPSKRKRCSKHAADPGVDLEFGWANRSYEILGLIMIFPLNHRSTLSRAAAFQCRAAPLLVCSRIKTRLLAAPETI
jgi:hypothetical protein